MIYKQQSNEYISKKGNHRLTRLYKYAQIINLQLLRLSAGFTHKTLSELHIFNL